jgi:hypothetical protein
VPGLESLPEGETKISAFIPKTEDAKEAINKTNDNFIMKSLLKLPFIGM